jgi:hypothetical protein
MPAPKGKWIAPPMKRLKEVWPANNRLQRTALAFRR